MKQKVYCVVSHNGQVMNRYPENKEVYEDSGRKYVIVEGLRYRLNQFNEYEMAYGEKSSHVYRE